jgi:hypothetical protein
VAGAEVETNFFLVMAGHSRPKDGVASARLCPDHDGEARSSEIEGNSAFEWRVRFAMMLSH